MSLILNAFLGGFLGSMAMSMMLKMDPTMILMPDWDYISNGLRSRLRNNYLIAWGTHYSIGTFLLPIMYVYGWYEFFFIDILNTVSNTIIFSLLPSLTLVFLAGWLNTPEENRFTIRIAFFFYTLLYGILLGIGIEANYF